MSRRTRNWRLASRSPGRSPSAGLVTSPWEIQWVQSLLILPKPTLSLSLLSGGQCTRVQYSAAVAVQCWGCTVVVRSVRGWDQQWVARSTTRHISLQLTGSTLTFLVVSWIITPCRVLLPSTSCILYYNYTMYNIISNTVNLLLFPLLTYIDLMKKWRSIQHQSAHQYRRLN